MQPGPLWRRGFSLEMNVCSRSASCFIGLNMCSGLRYDKINMFYSLVNYTRKWNWHYPKCKSGEEYSDCCWVPFGAGGDEVLVGRTPPPPILHCKCQHSAKGRGCLVIRKIELLDFLGYVNIHWELLRGVGTLVWTAVAALPPSRKKKESQTRVWFSDSANIYDFPNSHHSHVCTTGLPWRLDIVIPYLKMRYIDP